MHVALRKSAYPELAVVLLGLVSAVTRVSIFEQTTTTVARVETIAANWCVSATSVWPNAATARLCARGVIALGSTTIRLTAVDAATFVVQPSVAEKGFALVRRGSWIAATDALTCSTMLAIVVNAAWYAIRGKRALGARAPAHPTVKCVALDV